MTFKVGDKVKYTGDCATFSGALGGHQPAEGVVTDVGNRIGTTRVELTSRVRGYSEGSSVSLFTRNLELIKEPVKPFTFADIQKGDKIRRTKVYGSGATEVREGVAETKGSYYWADETTNFILAYDPTSEFGDVTYELLERPEPPKEPELWENREPGDKLVSYFKNDGNVERIFTKTDAGTWDTIVMSTAGKLQKGFVRSDHELAAYLKKYGNKVHLIKA